MSPIDAMMADAARCNARMIRDDPLHNRLRRARKPITVDGVNYESHVALADALGVSRAMVSKAKRMGRLHTLGLGR